MLTARQARTVIRRTCHQFPWYEALADSGLCAALQASAAEGEGAEALASLPFLTGKVLEEHYYTAEAASQLMSPADEVSCYMTSGTSSGRRKAIYYNAAEEEHYIAIKSELFGNWLRGHNISRVISDMGTGHAASTATAVFERLGCTVESLSFDAPIDYHLERLAAVRPELLYTMPSILEQIIQHAPDAVRFGIKKVILVGEIAAPAWQANMASQLGIAKEDILDTLGSIELGTIAAYSHVHQRYLVVDGLHAEVISVEELEKSYTSRPPSDNHINNVANSPASVLDSSSEDAVLVITSAVRQLFPAVRYVTYDLVRDFRPIEVDGRQRFSFAGIVGRIGPELKHGEKISLYDIEEAVHRHSSPQAIRTTLRGNRLSIALAGIHAGDPQLAQVQQAIMAQIPVIGAMVRGGILAAIEVRGEAADTPAAGATTAGPSTDRLPIDGPSTDSPPVDGLSADRQPVDGPPVDGSTASRAATVTSTAMRPGKPVKAKKLYRTESGET